jgi:hypothetical protein
MMSIFGINPQPISDPLFLGLIYHGIRMGLEKGYLAGKFPG